MNMILFGLSLSIGVDSIIACHGVTFDLNLHIFATPILHAVLDVARESSLVLDSHE